MAAPPDTPRPPASRWTSFVADPAEDPPRILSEERNPAHRLRVEHNRDTLLVHLSGEDGKGQNSAHKTNPPERDFQLFTPRLLEND